jgi:hypothetical protein
MVPGSLYDRVLDKLRRLQPVIIILLLTLFGTERLMKQNRQRQVAASGIHKYM